MAFQSKRIHSPTNEYDTTTRILPARKKVIPDDLFTNQMAAMSLEKNDTTSTHVDRIDDLDAYLNEGNNSITTGDGDTYLGDTPQLVGINMGTTILPFERIPGTTELRIPDFVIRSPQKEQPQDQYQPMDLD